MRIQKRTTMPSPGVGAAAGSIAAAAWLALHPLTRRVSGIDFDDTRLLGRMVVPNGPWRLVGTVMHLVNGAVFGALFVRFLKRPSVGKGFAAAQIENAVLWPTLALIDPIHPDRRNGHWPRFMTSPRIIVSEVIGHAIFGTVLGALTSRAVRREDGDA